MSSGVDDIEAGLPEYAQPPNEAIGTLVAACIGGGRDREEKSSVTTIGGPLPPGWKLKSMTVLRVGRQCQGLAGKLRRSTHENT